MKPVRALDSLSVFIGSPSTTVVISIGEFSVISPGVVLLEENTGKDWTPINMTKVGRGMITNVVAGGPAQFRGVIYGPITLRVRAQNTVEMEPIAVEIRWDGGTARHVLRAESKFVIKEAPDIRDLI